jgi:hypothetical protein
MAMRHYRIAQSLLSVNQAAHENWFKFGKIHFRFRLGAAFISLIFTIA